MELGWIQICVFLGLGAILGLLFGYFYISPIKKKKVSSGGNFGQIYNNVLEAEENLNNAMNILDNLREVLEEIQELKNEK